MSLKARNQLMVEQTFMESGHLLFLLPKDTARASALEAPRRPQREQDPHDRFELSFYCHCGGAWTAPDAQLEGLSRSHQLLWSLGPPAIPIFSGTGLAERTAGERPLPSRSSGG